MQSSFLQQESAAAPTPGPLHVGVIMDGNGRWAQRRGLPRAVGHRRGVQAIRRVVEAAPALGVGALTLFAFSTENWRRPKPEVAALMNLFRTFLATEIARLIANGVRLSVIGRRDRLDPGLVAAISRAEAATAGQRRLHLRLAVDYSGRDAILRAAADADPTMLTQERFSELLGDSGVDLIIRTSGEQRLSDFLLWEAAYAELYFTDQLWPDFDGGDLAEAIAAFQSRERRYGGLGRGVSA